MIRRATTALAAAFCLLLPGCIGEGPKGPETAPSPWKALNLTQIKMKGELGRRIDAMVANNFLAIDPDSEFLAPFRSRKPFAETRDNSERFIGLGMLIDAAVLIAQYTADPGVIARKEHIVKGALELIDDDGYIGAYSVEPGGAHLHHQWSFHDAAYIAMGLANDYLVFRNKDSLEGAEKIARLLMKTWRERPEDAWFTTLGIVEACFNLYAATGNRDYYDFAADEPTGMEYRIAVQSVREWNQEIRPNRYFLTTPERVFLNAAGQPRSIMADSCHMYRAFCRADMQLGLYQLEPDPKLLRMSRQIYEKMTRRHDSGMLVTGITSYREGWHETQHLEGPIAENCATMYEIFMLGDLARIEHELKYGDIIERAVYNSVMGSQHPDGSKIRYHMPPKGPRTFFPRNTFCCPNNFRRGLTRLPSQVYYFDEDTLAVNLFVASEANVPLREGLQVKVVQETDYPITGKVRLTLSPDKPVKFALQLRRPAWVGDDLVVRVNDDVEDAGTDSSHQIELVRTWEPGDTVTLEMPMKFRSVKGRELQTGRVAILRGPVVYTYEKARNPDLPETLDLRHPTNVWIDSSMLRGDYETAEALLIHQNGRYWMKLSPFPALDGEEVYFNPMDITAAVDDELIRD